MSYQIIFSSFMKADITRMKKRGFEIKDFKETIEILEKSGKLPKEYDTHDLRGEYVGYLDSHIQDDWILIWKKDNKRIFIVRTGTHSDLFK